MNCRARTPRRSSARSVSASRSAPSSRTPATRSPRSTRNLVETVRNTFVYYSTNNRGAGIDVIVLTGGGAHLLGLGQYLSSASRLPVTLGDPLADLSVARTAGGREAFAGHESRMALPVGLAFGVAA